MDRTEHFLDQVLRWSFLSKHEKREWKEEMQSHLQDSILEFKKQGYTDEKATELAIHKFGHPSKLRKTLTKETYGLTSGTILFISSVFLFLFLLSFFYMVCNSPGSGILSLISPSLYITLFISSVFMFKTRKYIDRVCIFILPMPFMLSYIITHFDHAYRSFDSMNVVNIIMSSAEGRPMPKPFGLEPVFVLGICFLFLYGILLYLVSKNQYISSLHIILTICYPAWAILRHPLRFLYLSAVHSPVVAIYNGYFDPFVYYDFLGIMMKVLVLIGLLLVNHFIEKRFFISLPKSEA